MDVTAGVEEAGGFLYHGTPGVLSGMGLYKMACRKEKEHPGKRQGALTSNYIVTVPAE